MFIHYLEYALLTSPSQCIKRKWLYGYVGISQVTGLGTRYLPLQGHLQACSECLPAGHEMWERCRTNKRNGFQTNK